MRHLIRFGLILWLCWAGGVRCALAQVGLKVREIQIRHIGPPAVSDEMIRSFIRVHEGDTYSRVNADDDVRTLYQTGYFYNIRVTDDLTPDGVILTYILQGKPRLTSIRFEGNKKFSNSKLRKKIKSKENEPLDEQQLFADSLEIQKLYQNKGYPQTEVKYVLNIDEQAGRGTATFQIKEGYKIKIKSVEFDGASAFKERKLRKVLKTRDYWMFSWLTGSGVFKEEQFEDDKERLREFYQSKGYIDFEILDVLFDHPSERKMIIRFVIYEGRQYKVGNVTLSGNLKFPTNEIMEVLQMTVGETFTSGGLRRDIEAIEDYYGAKGHIDVKSGTPNLRVKRIPNTESGTMDVEYIIDAGDPSYIEKIDIQGNSATKDRVLRRELAVAPGELFDMVKVKLSKRRLEGLQYFEKVDVDVEKTEIPDRKNLEISVEEKSTGSLTFGAGFSTVDSIVGFAEMTQGNFDLFHPPTFRGGGQKFRLRVQLGTQRQDYTATFIEPWFLGRKLALGVDAYHRELNFQSEENLYDERRTGGRVSLTKTLGSDFLIGSIFYGLENVGIVNVDPGSPQTILNEKGFSLISRAGMSIAYDTRNSTLLPDKGQKTELEAELAGGPLGGEKDFYKLEAKTAWYFPGFFSGHVLEVVGRTGVAQNYGRDSEVPFYERYYLGGISSLRGYDYRTVGPREAGTNGQREPVGGDTYWFGSAEYSLPIIERLRLAVFYDIGNLMMDSYDFDFRDYTDNWGVGIRLNLPIGPLRLDYGIPINHGSDNGDSGKFQFSVGYRRDL